jgi:hypothetical protein
VFFFDEAASAVPSSPDVPVLRGPLGRPGRPKRPSGGPAVSRRAHVVPALAGALAVVLLAIGCGSSAPTTSSSSEPSAADAGVDGSKPPVIKVTDVPNTSQAVAPVAGSPIRTIRRDCQINAPLSDGRSLWIFCDTTQFEPPPNDQKLRLFKQTTAAFAENDAPTVLKEPLDKEDKPFQFLEPSAAYTPCTPDQTRFLWPSASVTTPTDDGKDRILVWYQSNCVKANIGVKEDQFRDIGIAEYIYDPKNPPSETTPINGKIINEQLFKKPADSTNPFGQAALLQDGQVYAYRCDTSGECFVARAPVGEATKSDAYRFWNGEDWVEGEDNASPMESPGVTYDIKPSVRYFPSVQLYAMIDTHDLDLGDLQLRVARAPQGPWSEPVTFAPPGCNHNFPTQCFAFEIQPALSEEGKMAISYFNPATGNDELPSRFIQVGYELS